MKIKGVIEDLKFFKNDNSKNISRNFSGAVVGSVGSVQFQIVPCSNLYFSRSIGPFQCESEAAQSCLTVCDPINCSLPGSSVHGIFQAIVLEWIAISFSRGSS